MQHKKEFIMRFGTISMLSGFVAFVYSGLYIALKTKMEAKDENLMDS